MALLMFCRFPNSLIGQFTQVFVSDIIDWFGKDISNFLEGFHYFIIIGAIRLSIWIVKL
jgi:hypothetical protein